MRSHRALLIGVLLPAAFSPLLWRSLTGGPRHGFRHGFRYERTFRYSELPAPPPPPWAPLAPVPPAAWDASCETHATRTLSAPADAADQLDLPGGLTALSVDEASDLDHVEVEATLCGGSEAELDALQLSLERDGDHLRVRTGADADAQRSARLELRVTVPFGLETTVQGDGVGRFGMHGRRMHRRGPGWRRG